MAFLIYWFLRGSSTLARWLPRSMRHGIGYTAGILSYLIWYSKRKITQQNMAIVTDRNAADPYVKYLAFTSWKKYGRYAADFINFPNFDIEVVEPTILDISQGVKRWQDYHAEAMKAGHGVIFATAHFGNWDVAGTVLAHNATTSAVAETFSDKRLNTFLQNLRIEKGIGVIPMEGTPRRILRALQQQQSVCFLVDRPLEVGQGVPVTFFGRTTYVPGGPATLALKSGAPILSGYTWYGHNNQFYLRVFPPIFPNMNIGKLAEQKEAEIIRLTQCIYDSLEEMVREWPTQWYMFRSFWPSPLAEKSE